MIDKVFIKGLLSEILGCTVVWVQNSEPKPNVPYAVIRLHNYRSQSLDEVLPTSTPGQVEVRGVREATLTVKYFGQEANLKLVQLEQALQKPTVVDRCFGAGVAFFDAANTQDLTNLQDGGSHDEQAAIDFSVRLTCVTQDNPGYISHVEMIMNESQSIIVKEENNG